MRWIERSNSPIKDKLSGIERATTAYAPIQPESPGA
jgi:hypothetical protein